MTPRTGRPAGTPFAVMLRGAFLPTVLLAPAAALVAAAVSGGRAALGASLGAAVALTFLSLGLLVMHRLDATADPLRLFASAVAVVLGQLLFLLLVLLALQGAAWLDNVAFGLAALAVALAWQAFQVLAWVRSRRPIFDLPDDDAAEGALQRDRPRDAAGDPTPPAGAGASTGETP